MFYDGRFESVLSGPTNKDQLQVAVRKMAFPFYQEINDRTMSLVVSDQTARSLNWRNIRDKFFGLERVALTDKNSTATAGELLFHKGKSKGQIAVKKVTAKYDKETVSAQFSKKSTPLLTHFSFSGAANSQSDILEMLADQIGIKLLCPQLDFDLEDLSLNIIANGKRLRYVHPNNGDVLHGSWDSKGYFESIVTPEKRIPQVEYVNLLKYGLEKMTLFR